MATNKLAVDVLNTYEYGPASKIVDVLIRYGFLEADEMTEPERYAQGARDWIYKYSPDIADTSAKTIFDKASGWNTEGWEAVMGNEPILHNNTKIKNIFAALVILAKEAGEL